MRKKEINKKILVERKTAQLPKWGIVVCAFIVVGVAQVNNYVAIGVAFLFMLLGGGWAMWDNFQMIKKENKYL